MTDSDWVRIRQPETGHHITIPRSVFETEQGLTELKQDAVDGNGDPLPPKYRTDKGSARSEANAEKEGK